jgi:plastocyanin
VKRRVSLTLVYAIVAALAVAAPLSATPEPAMPGPAAQVAEPAPAPPPGEPTAPAPAEPAPQAPAEPAPPAAAPAEPAQPVPAPPAEPAAASAPPEPQEIRDTAPVARQRKDKPKAVAAADTSVTIRDFEFSPSSITINVGDTVTWSNEGPTPHSATAEDGSFDTGIFEEGQSRSHTFNEAGTFAYICTPHPNMKGTVVVQAAGSGDTGAAGDDGTSGDADSTGSTGTSGADSQADSGSSLPATGLDAGGMAVIGLMTLALGTYLRRRAASAGS